MDIDYAGIENLLKVTQETVPLLFQEKQSGVLVRRKNMSDYFRIHQKGQL